MQGYREFVRIVGFLCLSVPAIAADLPVEGGVGKGVAAGRPKRSAAGAHRHRDRAPESAGARRLRNLAGLDDLFEPSLGGATDPAVLTLHDELESVRRVHVHDLEGAGAVLGTLCRAVDPESFERLVQDLIRHGHVRTDGIEDRYRIKTFERVQDSCCPSLTARGVREEGTPGATGSRLSEFALHFAVDPDQGQIRVRLESFEDDAGRRPRPEDSGNIASLRRKLEARGPTFAR